MKLAGKRLGLGAAALLTMAGVALVAPNVASAHHLNISGSTTCRDAQGNFPVSWTVNHPGASDWGTFYGSNGAVIAPGGTWTTTTTGSGNQAQLSVAGYFDKNGNGVQDGGDQAWGETGSVSKPGECEPPPKKVQICHRDQGNPQWKVIEISENALNSHLSHQWGQDIYPVPANGCPPPPPTENQPPKLSTQHDCLADGPAMGVLTPSSGNWTASDDLDPSQFGVKIDVTANPGFIFPGGKSTISLAATATEENTCEATPVIPEVIEQPKCGVVDTYTIPTTPGVQYLVDGTVKAANTYNLQPGQSVTVTAQAAPGFRLTTPLSKVLTGGPDTTCVKPGTPTLQDTTECGELDTYTIPTTPGVIYLVDGAAKNAGTYELPAGTTVVITAQAEGNYELGGTPLKETFVGGEVEPCPPTEWEDPTPGALCGPNNDPISVPSDTPDVDYESTGWVNGKLTVTAVWTKGDHRTLETWTFTDHNKPCPTDVEEPTYDPKCGPNNDDVLVPEDTDDVEYEDTDWVDGKRTITARWTNDDSVLGTWNFVDEDIPCPPTEWEPPAQEPVCGPENDMVDVPVDTDDVVYEVSGWVDGERTVTAYWTYDDSELDSWTFTDDNETCPPTEWEPPTQEPVCGPGNDMVSVPADTADVVYEDTGWVDGERTVTAYWTGDDSELDLWTFTDDNEVCPTPPPAGLDISAVGPVCLRDAPYIELTFGNQPQFNGQPATVTFVDLQGNAVETQTATYQAGTTVRFVYPGASVDGAGNPVDWPGWVFSDGQWVVDPSDVRLRDGLTVVVEVNPTATATVSYPPPAAACANPPTVRDPATPQGSLPQTGSSTGPIAAVATGLLMAGGAALLATRRSAASR